MDNFTSSVSYPTVTPDRPAVPPVNETGDVEPPERDAVRRLIRVLGHLVVWTVTLTVVGLAIWGGLRLRRWTWELAKPVHFLSDINRGYYWGNVASGPEGYLNLYEKMVHEVDATDGPERGKWSLFLDYAPLRLAVMTWWGHRVRAAGLPDPGKWRHDYAFHWPPLWFNAAMELIGVVSTFFLVRRWVIVSDRGPPAESWPREWMNRLRLRRSSVRPDLSEALAAPHCPFRGWWQGLVAALLLWFNPVAITNAHAWPTWDMWVPAMYLLGLLAASYGRWFWAGAVIGVGGMLKGQLYFGAPVFLAWTLLNGDWRNALRWACGAAAGVAAVASPWLVTYIPADALADQYKLQATFGSSRQFPAWIVERLWNRPAIIWSGGVLLVAIVLPFVTRDRRPRVRHGGELIAAVLLQWPIFARFGIVPAVALIAASLAVLLSARLIRRWPDRLVLVFGATAAALLGGVHFFDASNAWWRCGINYGTHHYPQMHMGAANLPALLNHRFGWQSPAETMFTLGTHKVTVQQATRGLFYAGLAVSLWAVARQARRRDPRLLVAVVAPWLVFFSLPTQIHERYIIYGAAVAAVCVGQSIGMALLGVFLTAVAWVTSVRIMLGNPLQTGAFGAHLQTYAPDWFGPTSGFTLYFNLNRTYPDVAWAVLLAMLVTVYVAVTTTRRPVPSPGTPGEG